MDNSEEQHLIQRADHAVFTVQCSHVAAIIVTPDGEVVDHDLRGQSLLKSGQVLRTHAKQLRCADAGLQAAFSAALRATSASGRTSNLLLHAPREPDQRYSLTMTRMQRPQSDSAHPPPETTAEVLCLIAPLDGRRVATAQQLMDFFGLSRAEARLARAICHGDSVEDYARDQGLKLPTVRTQLSSAFKKTATTRQAELVRLIAAIPAVRDASERVRYRGPSDPAHGDR